MPGPARADLQVDERHAVGVDEGQRPVGQHVVLQPIGQPDGLPDPHDLFVGGDRPGAIVDIRITLDDNNFQAKLAQEVRGGRAGRTVADDGHVVGL